MYEMEYLTEDDMPYFRELAKEGKAVIIELTKEALLSLDPASFKTRSGEIDQNELERVLREKSCEIKARASENRELERENLRMEKDVLDHSNTLHASRKIEDALLEGEADTRLMERLSQINLTAEQWNVVSDGIVHGLSDGEMEIFLHENLSTEQMRKLCDALIHRKERRVTEIDGS